jgi:hypothetical protein
MNVTDMHDLNPILYPAYTIRFRAHTNTVDYLSDERSGTAIVT